MVYTGRVGGCATSFPVPGAKSGNMTTYGDGTSEMSDEARGTLSGTPRWR